MSKQARPTPSRRESLVESITDAVVADLVLHGQESAFAPGKRTSENRILEALGGPTSRTPVREALALLVQEGMFEQVPQVGVALRDVTTEEFNEIFELRRGLESLAVDRLAGASPRPDLSELQELVIEESGRTLDLDGDGVMQAAGRFHLALVRLSGLTTGARSLQAWLRRLRIAQALHPADPGSLLGFIVDHKEILNAISSGDRKEAVKVLLTHLSQGRKELAPANRASTRSLAAEIYRESAEHEDESPPTPDPASFVRIAMQFEQREVPASAGLVLTRAARALLDIGSPEGAARVLGRAERHLKDAKQEAILQTPSLTEFRSRLEQTLGSKGLQTAIRSGKTLSASALEKAVSRQSDS
jgi:DNA-binding GntR family transcriptional regulator